MSRSIWATAVGASVFAFALTPAAALAASPSSAAARPARAPAKPHSRPAPMIDRIVPVHVPSALAHPKRASAPTRVVARHPVIALLALGSVYHLVGNRFGPVLKTAPSDHHQPRSGRRSPGVRADAHRRLDEQAARPGSRRSS